METSYAEWLGEIIVVRTQILRWLQSQSVDEPLIRAIHSVDVWDAILLGVEDTLWICITLQDEYCFDESLCQSEIWECAVAAALTEFKRF